MSFARTKIQQPRPRSGLLLPRPALEEALVAALLNHRVVLVCAAAGYGKSALLGRALEQLPPGHASAWVSLDEGDDLHRLLDCLIAALEPFDPPWRTAPEGLIAAATRPDGKALPDVADEIVNTLDACELPHGVIVLDDLQHLSDPACLSFLDRWLQRMSPRWTVAMAARHEPALRLGRLRAAGELADFGEAQLRFGRDEVRQLMAGSSVGDEAADALHARTAGWAAGLRLALNGARGGSPGSAIDRQAFDFLATEVLARIDPRLRGFLLQTSVLHDLDAPRCAAVSGSGGDGQAERWLEEIERLGLFATVVDDVQPTLRLHDLFRDALQHRLKLEQPQAWPQLLERAATVETDPVRRQALLLAAGQPEQAARALLHAGTGLITQGGVKTVLNLIDQFPPAFAETSAELHRVAGMANWTIWDARAAERHLGLADKLFTARGDPALAQVARGHRVITLIGLGRLHDAGAVLASLDEQQAMSTEARIVIRLARTWHAMESGALHAVAPLFDALVQALEERPALEVWFFTVPPPRQTVCRGMAPGLARWAAGALRVGGDRPWALRALALLAQGWHALWQGRLDDTAALLLRAEADALWTGHQVVARSQSLALRALLAALRGDHEAALATLQARLAEQPAGYGDWGLWHHLYFASRVASACGNAVALRDWSQRALALQPGLPDADAPRLRPWLGALGTLAWLEGRRDEAISQWRAALLHEEHIDLLGQAADVRVRLAAALVQRRALAEAASWLKPLLVDTEAGPGGALLAGEALQELSSTAWGPALAPHHALTLQRWAAMVQPRRGSSPAVATADAPEAEFLSPREAEVLAQIAEGASNKLIARALDLSPHTVKRHVANILDKLALASRGQAAAWYRAQAGSALPDR
ncbi:LuxR C-terminal-related transcriptional regulator [Aquabacterium sp.]|uniref:LuxR C-terminal-related transcriptional regulator n=1 Tax=Aquabacterium sp. TaxID=1872578 RepID=UPI002C8BCD4A|nr:LuxR C-terminal-related transcriptional regulator [Aquabacterium sp.]HSW05430.1 LuxR C-terminal-related transcriptional regulator [Aquabacterium sp.]